MRIADDKEERIGDNNASEECSECAIQIEDWKEEVSSVRWSRYGSSWLMQEKRYSKENLTLHAEGVPFAQCCSPLHLSLQDKVQPLVLTEYVA